MAPVVASMASQDIRVADMRGSSTPRPPPQEGGRLYALISALFGAGPRGGYLANARLKEVHWQVGRTFWGRHRR